MKNTAEIQSRKKWGKMKRERRRFDYMTETKVIWTYKTVKDN